MIIYPGEVIMLAESYLKHATNRDNNQMQPDTDVDLIQLGYFF